MRGRGNERGSEQERVGKFKWGRERKSFIGGDSRGYNVRESVQKRHFESEKEEHWEKIREVDSNR